MRAVFSIRFVATCAAILALALIVAAFADDRQGLSRSIVGVELTIERSVDLVEEVADFESSVDFGIGEDGLTTGFADVGLAGDRIMRIPPGTPGENSCEVVSVSGGCVVFADLLGDAVVWFAFEDLGARNTVQLGPIVDLDDGDAVFETGWRIAYPPVIERVCDGVDIPSFSDFLRRFGPDSTTTIDLETQAVASVTCGNEVVEPGPEDEPIGGSIGAYADTEATLALGDADSGEVGSDG